MRRYFCLAGCFESFFATLRTERYAWPTRDALRMAVLEFIEVFYNRRRRHKHLGQLSPDAFEKRWYEQQLQAQVASP